MITPLVMQVHSRRFVLQVLMLILNLKLASGRPKSMADQAAIGSSSGPLELRPRHQALNI
jgi:hypothetical protein